MPDYPVKADVDTMLRANDKAGIRSAIGVGTTDAPTFLAQTLTGQSLTGTQATSLVDLSATWNTTGNPSLIYGRVTNTNSGASANLIDLGTFAGGSLFKVDKAGNVIVGAGGIRDYGSGQLGIGGAGASSVYVGLTYFQTTGAGGFALGPFGSPNTFLTQDAPGILAQRNGVNAQAFRVYNTFPGTGNNEYAEIAWSANYMYVRPAAAGSGVVRGSVFGVAGSDTFIDGSSTTFRGPGNSQRWTINLSGHFLAASDNVYDIGASGANRPKNIYAAGIVAAVFLDITGQARVTTKYEIYGSLNISSPGDGIMRIANGNSTDFGRLQLGSTTNAFPAIARDGAGIKITGAAAGSTSWIKIPAVAVASLPSAATAGVGARSFVNDALSPVFGSAVTGGGAVTVPVYSTGSAWNVG